MLLASGHIKRTDIAVKRRKARDIRFLSTAISLYGIGTTGRRSLSNSASVRQSRFTPSIDRWSPSIGKCKKICNSSIELSGSQKKPLLDLWNSDKIVVTVSQSH